MKKTILSLFFAACPLLYSMHNNCPIDYSHFFQLCKNGEITPVKKFIEQHPTINIEHQNEHEETPLLYAVSWKGWNLVWFLLEQCKANKMVYDTYGQTLFSKATYHCFSYEFKKLLKIYSLDEINTVCKTMNLKRNNNDKKRCLAKIIMMPQHQLTKINIALALENK